MMTTETAVQPLADTNLAIEEAAEEVRRENERRYLLPQLIRRADAVLNRLELRNLRDQSTVGKRLARDVDRLVGRALATVPRWLADASDLAGRTCEEGTPVMEALDRVYQAQDLCFNARHPWRWELLRAEGEDDA